MSKSNFKSSSINNRTGCREAIDPYPCVDKKIGPSIEYPLENQNYDLMKETHHWGPNQFQPDLLLPQIKQYKQLSGRDSCYVNTANPRSTLYDSCYCDELGCGPNSSPNNKEKFTNLTPEARLNWPGCLESNHFNTTDRSILTNSQPRSILNNCECNLPGCDLSPPNDIQKSKDKEKFSNLLVEHREQIRDNSFCGYFYDDLNTLDVYKHFTPSIAYDLPGYDSNELQELPCL